MSYEYLLKFWGEGEQFVMQSLRINERNLWFATRMERNEFKQRILTLTKNHGRIIVFAEYEGFDVRKRTVTQVVFEFEGKKYLVDNDFGYGYPPESAEYMFTSGNFSCDCNRSMLIHNRYPDFPEYDECGDEIEMVGFEVVLSSDKEDGG